MAHAGKLAASFAHSIRNPLTSIKMRLYSLRRIDLPLDQKDDLEVITEEICNIENLVKDFLELSRPIKMKQERISPSDVIDKAVRLLRSDLGHGKVQIHVYRSHRLPEIWVDVEQFEAIVNLIINAFDAIGDKNGAVSIYEKEVRKVPSRQSAVIEIHDNGAGIPVHVQDKMFEPFFTTKEEGTGLGLSIARRIVEAHGGRLSFNSKENVGTTFRIALPYSYISYPL